MLSRPRRRWLGVTTVVLVAATACTAGRATEAHPASTGPRDWQAVLAAAKGQTVNWYMWGGDSTLNAFITGPLAVRLKRYGVSINQVKITDTVDAINKMLAEKQAGRSSGAVDLVWVNGENFATGKQAGLWRCGYPTQLPNTRYVNQADPAITHDFGLPVDGCESPWQQADSALVYDSSKLGATDVRSISALSAWARSHPGRFTYPAPPDFTGSMVVRSVLYDTAAEPDTLATTPSAVTQSEAALWQRLNTLAPSLWRHGSTYPASENDLETLYANGEVDAFFTYGPGSVADKVAKGVFPKTTREAVPSSGNIANTSFVGIPDNAAHSAAAMVVANELLDPAVQLGLYRAEGAYPAISLSTLTAAEQLGFAAVHLGPNVLDLPQLTAHTRPELPATQVTALEAGWKRHVQQRHV